MLLSSKMWLDMEAIAAKCLFSSSETTKRVVKFWPLTGGRSKLFLYYYCSLQKNLDPPGDRQYIMDGNYSQNCKKVDADFDRDSGFSLLEKMWVKKEVVEGINNVAPSKNAVAGENHFRAADTSEARNKRYPITGLFACVCSRHEIVGKLADMFRAEGSRYPAAVLRSLDIKPGFASQIVNRTNTSRPALDSN
ncbi:unnamed protein product [Mucor hiemalis]